MANHKQAIKRHKQNVKRAERNAYYEATARTLLKRARLAIDGGDAEAAPGAVSKAIAWIDRIAVKGVIHKNKASRLKSRLTRRLNSI